jgi:hypothetical protein
MEPRTLFMLLDDAHSWLGWPKPEDILLPSGSGPKVYRDFAKRKIEAALKREMPTLVVRTGVLVANPQSPDSTAPLAIVCEFPNGASDPLLDEAHRLAWSFSRTALLVTLEPHRLIAWSCHMDPGQSTDQRQVCKLPTPDGFSLTGSPEQRSVRDLLHWVSLITGHFQRRSPEKFPAKGRADELLLKNLKHVRGKLVDEMNLPREYCHDLLARIIFTQFLFHRRDSDGNPFFSASLLERLHGDVLRKKHETLESILRDKDEIYSLFRWLDERFNGDLFPGKFDSTEEEREKAWQTERDAVHPEHLQLLAELVSGTIDTKDRQLRLWPEYSFDVIPLEFISSIYEEFLNEDKYKNRAFYTPSHLVDYLLDAVLPWEGDEWYLRILDPSCGSGIFLVKAFQRLIHRWRCANGREPLVSDLKPILANNLVGIDINPEAIRVASFSLYLAMADAIEPKHYVTREKVFPRLRGFHLIANDYFDETTAGYRTKEDSKSFDLAVGNAPWGESSVKKTSRPALGGDGGQEEDGDGVETKAQRWAKEHEWPVVNYDIGPLFVAKTLELVSNGGHAALVQPALLWLYHRGGTAFRLRQRLFGNVRVNEITNLIAVRHELFPSVIGPACILVMNKRLASADTPIFYYVPKPLKKVSPSDLITIESCDVSEISHAEAASDPLVWSILALGSRRDWSIVRKLSRLDTLAKLKSENRVLARGGMVPGDQKKELPELRGKPYLESKDFPADVFLELDAGRIPPWSEPFIHSLHGIKNYEEFKIPQLLIKQSFSAEINRFRATLVRSDDPVWGVICKETYLSVHDLSPDASHIRAACLVYNSRLAVYYLALTSSRFPLYNNEVPTKELRTVPLPKSTVRLTGLESFEAIDEMTRELFELTQSDWAVIEDLLEVTLPDCLRKTPGPGRNPTSRSGSEPELSVFAQTMIRVLKGTFGKEKSLSATIYQEPSGHHLPVRMVTLHFDWLGRKPLTIESITADGLLDLLNEFTRKSQKAGTSVRHGDGFGFRRVAYLFHSYQIEYGRIRNLTIIKPDERRFWTRSLAMRDADDLAGAILKAAGWKGGSK